LTAYSEHADVKAVLQIPNATTTYDDEIDDCITSGDALLDKLLEPYELTVPGSVPQVIKDASAYFAAWLFRRRRDPVGSEAFYVEARKFLDAYVSDEEEVAFRVVSDE
jgi:hypothetical protein